MPPQPLLDLAGLDLSRVKIDRKGIEDIIPHRHHMALLDGILHVDLPRLMIVGYKEVRGDEFWSEGHFPGNPILPGVVMVEASGQLAVLLHKLALPEMRDRLMVFGGVDEVRFRGVVRPGSRLLLIGQGMEVSRRVAKCRMQGLVDGKVVYEGVILGLPT